MRKRIPVLFLILFLCQVGTQNTQNRFILTLLSTKPGKWKMPVRLQKPRMFFETPHNRTFLSNLEKYCPIVCPVYFLVERAQAKWGWVEMISCYCLLIRKEDANGTGKCWSLPVKLYISTLRYFHEHLVSIRPVLFKLSVPSDQHWSCTLLHRLAVIIKVGDQWFPTFHNLWTGTWRPLI